MTEEAQDLTKAPYREVGMVWSLNLMWYLAYVQVCVSVCVFVCVCLN